MRRPQPLHSTRRWPADGMRVVGGPNRTAVLDGTHAGLSGRRLAVAIAVSLGLHAALLATRFVAPDPARIASRDSPLEVVLLNASNRTVPLVPEVLAQVPMQAGGEHDRGRAVSWLPLEHPQADGQERAAHPVHAKLADAAGSQPGRSMLAVAQQPDAMPEMQDADHAAAREIADAAEATRAIASLQAQIARDIEEVSKRPKRLTFGVNAVGVSYARYVGAWADRIERLGTQHFPPDARGRLYDSLVVLAEIDRHGKVVAVRIPRKSRHEVLNRAARDIVLAGQPYDRFTPEMAEQGDVLQIVRTWTFTNGALETTAVP